MYIALGIIVLANILMIAKVNNWAYDVKKFEKNNSKDNIHFIN